MSPWIELLVLTVAAARLGAVLAMPAARREIARHRWIGPALLAGAAATLTAVVWLAASRPPALRVVAVGVVTIWLLVAWRAHPAYGRRRRLPPGSLGMGASLRAIVDPEFYAAEAARHGPVFKMAQFHRPVACLVGLERGRRTLRTHAASLAPPPLPLSNEVPRGFLRYMTPADHDRYAAVFRAAFSEGFLTAMEPAAAREVDRAFASLAAASARSGGAGVDPRPTLQAHLLAILLDLFFGGLLRAEDRAVVEMVASDADYANAIGRPSARARAALHAFERLIAERRAMYDARDDPSVWGELTRLDPAALGDRTVVGNLFLMLQAAWDSIGGIVVWTVQMLGTVPEWVRAVQAGPAAPGDDPYGRAVLEALRLAQSEYIYRRVLRPIEVDGFVVPRGWFLRICVAESHRLDPPFERPTVFDPDRHRGRRFSAHEFAPFGFDDHACLGARMTVRIGRVFAERLVEGFSWVVVADGPRERGNRHWNHWRPSARFRIALRARGEAGP